MSSLRFSLTVLENDHFGCLACLSRALWAMPRQFKIEYGMRWIYKLSSDVAKLILAIDLLHLF